MPLAMTCSFSNNNSPELSAPGCGYLGVKHPDGIRGHVTQELQTVGAGDGGEVGRGLGSLPDLLIPGAVEGQDGHGAGALKLDGIIGVDALQGRPTALTVRWMYYIY